MTKQHFIAMAAEFKTNLEIAKPEGELAYNAVIRVINGFCDIAQSFNPKFSRSVFRRACGIAVLPPITTN